MTCRHVVTEIHLYVDELNEMAATLTVMECLIERENER